MNNSNNNIVSYVFIPHLIIKPLPNINNKLI